MMRRFLPVVLLVAAGSLAAAEFTPLDRAEAQRLLSADKHRQPTVVTLWSSDCGYCKANLKLLSSLTRNNRKLRVITVAAEPENAHLWPMLSRYGLAGPHYAYGSDSPEAIAYAIDRDFIVRALDSSQWQIQTCADALGISRKTLWEKMRRLGIEREEETDAG